LQYPISEDVWISATNTEASVYFAGPEVWSAAVCDRKWDE